MHLFIYKLFSFLFFHEINKNCKTTISKINNNHNNQQNVMSKRSYLLFSILEPYQLVTFFGFKCSVKQWFWLFIWNIPATTKKTFWLSGYLSIVLQTSFLCFQKLSVLFGILKIVFDIIYLKHSSHTETFWLYLIVFLLFVNVIYTFKTRRFFFIF